MFGGKGLRSYICTPPLKKGRKQKFFQTILYRETTEQSLFQLTLYREVEQR